MREDRLPIFEVTITTRFTTRVRTRFSPLVGRQKQSDNATSKDCYMTFSACERPVGIAPDVSPGRIISALCAGPEFSG